MDPGPGSWSWFQEAATAGEESVPPESLLGVLCSPNCTEQNCPCPNPWVLTAFSAPPKNRTPVECGSSGSGGATGGGRLGGSSLLLRRGLGLATSLGSLCPRCRGRVGRP